MSEKKEDVKFDEPLTEAEKKAEDERYRKYIDDAIAEQHRKARMAHNPFMSKQTDYKKILGGK